MAEPAMLLATDRPALPPPARETAIWPLRFAGTGLSLALHIGIAAAAIYVLPSQISGAERGGSEQAIEIAFVGEEEATGTVEGAQPIPVAVIVEEAPPGPATALPRVDPRTAAPVTLQPDVERAAADPLPPSSAPTSVQQKPVEAKPEEKQAATPVIHAPKPRKAETAPRIMTSRPKSEAKGMAGEGSAAANRLATTRGGTGGVTPTAGSAALGSYRSRLVAHLTRYKTYPEQAQDRGITGRNAVTITVSREGVVLASSLANPSGHALLDNATLAALKRAQPFPPMPEGGPGSITVTIGLKYELR